MENKTRIKEIIPYENALESEYCEHIGNKSYNLAKLHKHFPVPEGYCIVDTVYEQYKKTGKINKEIIDSVEKIRKEFDGAIAIRSSANCEDGNTLTMAGIFSSKFVTKEEEIELAIKEIYDDSGSSAVEDYLVMQNIQKEQVKVGLVVQKLIKSEVSGVIYTGINNDNLLIQYYEGYDENLLDEGTSIGTTIIVNQEGEIRQSNGYELCPIPAKLIKDLAGYAYDIRNFYQGVEQDIEFSIYQGNIYILQSRTLTTDLGVVDITETEAECLETLKHVLRKKIKQEKEEFGTETAIFSDSNYSELLPKPTPMDFGIYGYIFTGIDGIGGATQAARNEMGYLNGKESIGIIQYIGGRTYFSITRNAALYYIGFPDTKEEYNQILVNDYLDQIRKDVRKGAYPQMSLYMQDPTLDELEERFGAKSSEYFKIYQQFVKNIDELASSYYDCFEKKEKIEIYEYIEQKEKENLEQYSKEEIANYCMEILEHMRTKTCICFVKAARLGFYYSQKIMVEFERNMHINHEKSSELFSILTQGLENSAITKNNLRIAQIPDEQEALKEALKLIGHYSVGEMLEIRHPRLKDEPSRLLAYVKGIRGQSKYIDSFQLQKEERQKVQEEILQKFEKNERRRMQDIITNAQVYMALRETVKYLFSVEYSLVKDGLEMLESNGNLEKGDIYYLFPRELPRYVKNEKEYLHLIHSRKISYKNYEKIDMPSVIREEDVDTINLVNEKDDTFTLEQGSFLASGRSIEGIIVNLEEFNEPIDAYQIMCEYNKAGIEVILASKQMNLTHDPLIAIASGLVIENSGIVAHGAQRARELGKGALGGIKVSKLKTGDKVFFDTEHRFIQKL